MLQYKIQYGKLASNPTKIMDQKLQIKFYHSLA